MARSRAADSLPTQRADSTSPCWGCSGRRGGLATLCEGTESGSDDDILADGETFTWSYNTGAITQLCSFWFFGHGEVTVGTTTYDVTSNDAEDKQAGQALFGQLNNYFSTVGEDFCPDPDEIPEG